jgi:hypothetical protein
MKLLPTALEVEAPATPLRLSPKVEPPDEEIL